MSVMGPKDFGIVGFVSCGSILNPTNNKQAFVSNTDSFEAMEEWIKACFEDYRQQEFGVQLQERTGGAHLLVLEA